MNGLIKQGFLGALASVIFMIALQLVAAFYYGTPILDHPERVPLSILLLTLVPLAVIFYDYGPLFLGALTLLVITKRKVFGNENVFWDVFTVYTFWMIFGLWIAVHA